MGDHRPADPSAGQPRRAPREMWNAIFEVLRSGASIGDLPERFGPWETAWATSTRGAGRAWTSGCSRRCRSGSSRRAASTGISDAWTAARCGPSERPRGPGRGGSEEPAGHARGGSRGGFGSKLPVVAESHGVPLAAHVTAGQVNACSEFGPVVDRVKVGRRRRPDAMAGDKAPRTPRTRSWPRRSWFGRSSRGAPTHIPTMAASGWTARPIVGAARSSSASAGSGSAAAWRPASRSWP